MEPVVLTSLVRLSPVSDESLVAQLYRGIAQAVRDGRLPAGSRLPSTRLAAQHWKVSRNTVVAAYELLSSEGVIVQRIGAAPTVANLPATASYEAQTLPAPSARGAVLAAEPRLDTGRNGPLSPAEPDPDLFPADDWALCLRRAARMRPAGAENYAHYHGLPALRATLADQINRHRGRPCHPNQVLIVPGTQAALSLLALTLSDSGDIALIEDPGYNGARRAFLAAGLRLHALPVDGEGADCARIAPDLRPKLIYTTPSTQFPSGVRMSLARRLALIEMAKQRSAWIIEDDYDSEFVWHGREIVALSAQPGGERVIYTGSAAKTLLPGLRIGWIVAPDALMPALRGAQRTLGMAVNIHAQAALADFMSSGQYRAHLRKITRAYASRRGILAETLEAWYGNRIRLSNPDGGLQLVAEIHADIDELHLRDQLRAEGFAVSALSDYRLMSGAKGLVLGFAQMTPRQARKFAKALGAALRA